MIRSFFFAVILFGIPASLVGDWLVIPAVVVGTIGIRLWGQCSHCGKFKAPFSPVCQACGREKHA